MHFYSCHKAEEPRCSAANLLAIDVGFASTDLLFDAPTDLVVGDVLEVDGVTGGADWQDRIMGGKVGVVGTGLVVTDVRAARDLATVNGLFFVVERPLVCA